MLAYDSEKADAVEEEISDFDGVTYHLSTNREAKHQLTISLLLPGYEDLRRSAMWTSVSPPSLARS